MKCPTLFSGKSKKNIISESSPELAYTAVKVNFFFFFLLIVCLYSCLPS